MPSKSTGRDPEALVSTFKHAPLRFVRQQYLRFLQGLFWYRPKGQLHWDPDQEMSDIHITDEAPIQSAAIGSRPAILITRAPVHMMSLGLDDTVSTNLATGQKVKSILMPGTMSINCCSREPQESEDVCAWVAEQLWIMRDIMQRAGFFQIGQNVGIGAPSPAGSIVVNDSGREWYVTTATSPYQVQRTAAVTPLGQGIAKGIELVMTLGTAPRGPTWLPSGTTYSEAEASQRADLSEFDENGMCVKGDSVEAKTELAEPGTGYTSVLYGFRRRKLKPPRIAGRRLPLQQEDMGESAERGIDPIKIKVD